MLEKLAWHTFENTGNIDAYIVYRQLEDHEELYQNEPEEFSEILLES